MPRELKHDSKTVTPADQMSYAQRRAGGHCARCRKPSADGKAYCAPCRAYRTAWQKQLRQQRDKAGVCPQCGASTPKDRKWCEPCQEKNNAISRASHAKLWAQRSAAGVCVYCGGKRGRKGLGCARCTAQRANN